MNADDFIPYLGKTDDDPDMQALLLQLGATKAPKVKRGDIDARVSLKNAGIDMVFEPTDETRSSRLRLVAIQFSGTTQGGYFTPYAGSLPFGLTFTDTQAEARAKVGPPSLAEDEFVSDSWDYATHTLIADYPETRDRIGMVHLTVPLEAEE